MAPVPSAVIPVSAEPSIAGSVPVKLAAGMFPDPVILFPLRSKLPPSCGVVSSTTLALATSTIFCPSRRYIFLSELLTAISPSARSLVVGTDDAVLDLFGLKILAHYKFLVVVVYNGVC